MSWIVQSGILGLYLLGGGAGYLLGLVCALWMTPRERERIKRRAEEYETMFGNRSR